MGGGICLIIRQLRAFLIRVRYLFCALAKIGPRFNWMADFAFVDVRFFFGYNFIFGIGRKYFCKQQLTKN